MQKSIAKVETVIDKLQNSNHNTSIKCIEKMMEN